jgi:hypothetical protein
MMENYLANNIGSDLNIIIIILVKVEEEEEEERVEKEAKVVEVVANSISTRLFLVREAVVTSGRLQPRASFARKRVTICRTVRSLKMRRALSNAKRQRLLEAAVTTLRNSA